MNHSMIESQSFADNNLKYQVKKEMRQSFFYSLGIFCLCWKIKNKIHSIWCCDIEKILKLYFCLNLSNKELFYFPRNGEIIQIFRRQV